MEPNETPPTVTVMNSYYHHNHSQPPPPQHQSPPNNGTTTITTTATTPISLQNNTNNNTNSGGGVKKRGRPRKYNTPEEAAAARRAQLAQPKKPKQQATTPVVASPVSVGGFVTPVQAPSVHHHQKTASVNNFGNVGQGFTPHIISVAAGEDVYQRIMLFMQQSKREICILSASGSISSPFLRQPATSGGNITYEGRFDILSLSGSYIRTDLGGRTGGLSVCLASVDGQIIGGGVGGPLRAAGPVEVIVGTFLVEAKKELFSATKGMEQMV